VQSLLILRNFGGGMAFRLRFEHFSIYPVTLFLMCAVLLIIPVGCGNTCFAGFFNSNNNSNSSTVLVGGVSPSCSLPRSMIVVKAAAHLVHACSGCSASRQVTQLHLLLSGLELHPAAVADENSPEWQELAPDWALHPQWVDLVEDPASNDATLSPIVTGQISAGTYYQVRLHLAQPSSQGVEQLQAESHCSSVEAICVVTADGGFHSLQTLEGHPYLRVEATLPIDLRGDQPNLLRIEFRPESALGFSSTGVLDVLPQLHGRVVLESSPATDSF
jgi:hypothetical protein